MRRFIRHPSDIPIDIHVASVLPLDQTDCCLTNVSQGGLSCCVSQKIKVGSQVTIDIDVVTPPYHASARVMWCRKQRQGYEIGVQFQDEGETFKSRMVQQLCQIEHYKNRVLEREGRHLNGNQAAAEWIQKYAADFTR